MVPAGGEIPASVGTEVQGFDDRGFAFPVTVFEAALRATLQDRYRCFREEVANLESAGGRPAGDLGVAQTWANLRFRSHLFLPWLHDLLFSPARNGPLVAAARSALKTDDLVVWSTDWCVKDAARATEDAARADGCGQRPLGFFSWHQDSTYSGFSGAQAVTFWIAFSDVLDGAAGPLRFRAGSHRLGQLPHVERPGQPGNMLSLGQTVAEDVFRERVAHLREEVAVPLQTGQASVHDFSVVHASDENRGRCARVGLAVRVVRADAFSEVEKFCHRCALGCPERVTPLSCQAAGRPGGGDDREHFDALYAYFSDAARWCFELEPRAEGDGDRAFSPNSLREWATSMMRENDAYFEKAEASPAGDA